ncbi:EamA family transporter RarD [Bifidobacterium aquikefiricola]|uniref:EamA family transporter RarD n=1 Tax=Bifidobacterium aquikefiricola TaxID=3059038 RepID=A0AB39U4Z4_9BIFI
MPTTPPVVQTPRGLLAITISSVAWGLFPVYWDALHSVAPATVLAFRIITTMVTMMILLVLLRQQRHFFASFMNLCRHGMLLVLAIVAALLISANWLLYIILVNTGKTLEASASYFLMPVMNMLIAIIVLRERTNLFGWISIALAAVGVSVFIVGNGGVPWLGLIMALTFCGYGLLKRFVPLDSLQSLTFETAAVTPLAILWLAWQPSFGFVHRQTSITILLMGAGIVTAIPLITFAYGVQHSQYLTVGFVQYINPTLQFLSAIVFLHEAINHMMLIAFSVIWLSLAVYSCALVIQHRAATTDRTALTTTVRE